MKSGETRFVVKKLDTKKPYNSVGFRLSNGKTTIKKSTDAEDTKDKVLVQDGVFLIPLQQADTNALQGNVTLEAQINYHDHSVIMSDDNFLYINSSLGYDSIQGSAPAEDDGIEVVMTAIEEGVAVIVNPEASQELIDAVTELFQDTKQIAQSVRDDADNGEFDGYSPQVTVKTETPSTYILHIKDADHEFDTPNLKGQGGEGSIEVGDGLKREGNVVSILISEYLNAKKYLKFSGNDDGLYLDYTQLISDGLITPKNYVDDLANALGNALSVSIDSQTYVMTLQLKHNNQVLSTDTVDLPLETMVVDADYDSQTKEIVLTLQSGSTVRFSVADLVSGLQTEITSQNPLASGLVDDTHNPYKKFVTETQISEWTNKQDKIDSQHLLSTSLLDDTYSPNKKLVSPTEKQTWNAKADTSDIPTNVSELTNDSGYQTSSDVALAIIDKEDKTTISTDTTSTTVSLTLADNHEYRYTQELTSLTLTMPSGDFISSIVFASGSTPTSMTYDSNIKWSGDDVTNGQFVPTADKDYDICLYYNGLNINGIVRGV